MAKAKIAAALFCSASALVMASAAWGQAAPPQPAAAGAVEEVIVTGTRIVRDGYEAPTPTTTVTTQQLLATTPTNIPDALNKLPAFSGSRSMQGANNGGGTNNPGNFLNLRSFGISRTLILLDGHRVPPTLYDGTVDTNTIPEILVQRVDVVTGGASAVYGADAVTGVVNFILDRKFTGIKGAIQGGVAQKGDNKTWRMDLATGFDLTDNLHVIAGFTHNQADGIRYKEDRPRGDTVYCTTGGGTTANPYRLTSNCRLATGSYGGLITTGPLAGQAFNPDKSLFTFNTGTPTGTAGNSSGGDGIYWNHTTLVSPLNTTQAFGRADLRLNDDVTFYAQGNWTQSLTHFQNTLENRTASSVNKITVFSGNPFLPAAVQNVLTATNTPSFTLSRYSQDYGRATVYINTKSYNVSAGLEGKVFGDWQWGVDYTHGQGETREPTVRNTNNPRFYAAADAVRNPANGQIVCAVSLTANAGLYPGCVPIDVFGENNFSQAAAGYIYETTFWDAINKMDDVSGSLSGNIFNNWAGPVSLALSAEYRKASLNVTTNADPNQPVSFAGLRGGFTASTPLDVKNINAPSSGSNSVKEVAVETVFPLIVDKPFIKNLEVSGAYRFTDYSLSGSVSTWKLGLNYEPTDEFRFRLVRSRDIRAPTLFDLFAGRNVSQSSFSDPLTGLVGQPTLISQGNADLKPEVAKTSTVGVIYSPAWLPRARASIDLYDIRMTNAIVSLGGSGSQAQVNECTASGGTSTVCDLFVRPLGPTNTSAANFPTAILSQSLNVADTHTYGVDADASYSFDLDSLNAGWAGQIDLRGLLSYQPHLYARNTPTSVRTDAAGALGLPRLRATLSVGYNLGGWNFDAQTRYRSGMRPSSNPTQIFAYDGPGAVAYADIAISYKFRVRNKDDLTAFFSITNVFNTPSQFSPPAPTITGTPMFQYPGNGDVIGRMFTTGIRFKM
jgi:iron complex outermembrane receptor protein